MKRRDELFYTKMSQMGQTCRQKCLDSRRTKLSIDRSLATKSKWGFVNPIYLTIFVSHISPAPAQGQINFTIRNVAVRDIIIL